jgi:murein DD-endopeptidase MepM/ murein hydrolase activator NlpD
MTVIGQCGQINPFGILGRALVCSLASLWIASPSLWASVEGQKSHLVSPVVDPSPASPPPGISKDLRESRTELSAELSSKQVISGTIVLVKVILPTKLKPDTLSGRFDSIELPFYPAPEQGDGVYESVLGVPYEKKPGMAFVNIMAGEGADRQSLKIPVKIVAGRYKSETLHVDGRRVNPQSREDLARIEKDIADVGEIYRRVTPQKFWTGPFLLPIDSHITSPFGKRRLYNGKLKNFHTGADFKAATGTPVLSAAPGVVALAKDLFYTGNTVMVDHGYGVITLYAHMSELKVKVGQKVEVHEILGLSGQTGRVTGPHLHWMGIVHHVKINPLGLTQVIH